jgi:hypothetical protein
VAEYNRKPQVLIKRGMNITLPGDRLSQEWFQYLKNVRSYRLGEWRQRPGMVLQYSTGEPIYRIDRINNNIDGTFRRIIATQGGTFGNIYVDNPTHNSVSLVDTGYSLTDFSSVISRPDRSPLPYLFMGNSLRQSKFSPTGVRTEWGLAAPITPPEPFLLSRPTNIIMYGESAGLYTGVGGTPSSGSASFITTTVTYVLYDTGSTGMASIVPAVFTEALGIGMVFDLILGSTVFNAIIEDIFAPIVDTTIDSIAYDSGSTGLCTIQLATATTGLRKDTLIRLGGSENVRLLSVTDGLDGLPSFRCSTVANFASGASVVGLRSFRAFLTSTIVGGGVWTITTRPIDFSVSVPGLPTLTRTFGSPQNFASSFGRPLQPEDFICIGLFVNNFNLVTEIQVQFDCDGVTNDFTKNYFFKSLRQPDLQAAINQTVFPTQAQQTGITRSQIDQFIEDKFIDDRSPDAGLELGDLNRVGADQLSLALGSGFEIGQDQGPVSGEGTPGNGQWSMLFLPISDFQRVGSDSTRGWANIMAFRLRISCIGTPIVGFEAVWVGGTYGPNTVNLPEYTYVFRGRSSVTGSRSNPSPPNRSPINPKREAVYIQPTPLSDPQADTFDFYRIGGTLTNFHYVGSALAGTQFQDTIPDSIARRNPLLEVDRFKPWPRSDLPKSGTCNVIGTAVKWVSGDTFNMAWVRGTQIIIANRIYSFYTNPASSIFLQLNESGGAQTGVPFQIPDPQLDGQPMTVVFGPYSGASGEFLFGCKDPINPGYLYYTNGDDPESASDANYIELCNPSEKLMGGVVLDGIPYCFSDKRSWRILPSFQGGQSGGGSDFYPQETAMGKGLVGSFGICVGDAIYFVSFDGVYRSRGDVLESLTDESLAPLFNRDGTFISDTGLPVSSIDFTVPDAISLTYSFDGIYLSFKARDGNFYTYFMSFLTRGWMQDSIGTGQITRSAREVRTQDSDTVIVGTSGGKIMVRSNLVFRDDLDAISCEVWDREEIWDDLRSTKQLGDTIVDLDPANANITPTLRYENNTSSDVLTVITGNGRDQFVRDINSGSGRIVRGAALDLTWSDGTGGIPRVYAWEPAALVKPEESVNRATDWDNGGYTGTKWLQGFRLRGDTLGLAKSFQVETDGGILVEGFTFTANGEQVVTFWLTNPVVAHEFRIRGTDSDLWRNMGVEWVFEPEPEQASIWETQVTSFDLPFYSHMREVMIAHRSTADITMIVTTDGVSNTYPIPHGSGSRVRSYLPVKSLKAKFHSFRFTSSQPFGLWIKDIEVRVGPWGRTESYTIQRPFGDISRMNSGARV